MTEEAAATLDVREMPPRERHPMIFEVLDGLRPGQTLRLVNDHDPKPLYYQLMAERPGEFLWQSSVEGPDEWVVLITKKP